MARLIPLMVLALGCANDPDTKTGSDTVDSTPATAADVDFDPATMPRMSDARLLTRISLDLRGVRPTPAELDRLAADPDQLDVLVDEFVADPRFGDRVMEMWSEVYLTRSDLFGLQAADFDLDNEATFARAVGEEPLRILGRVAAEDMPWTELVLGDWTMADEQLAAAWNLDYEGPGWAPARYTDGRPAAGILATNGMWWRYTTTGSNMNRKRANQISRILTCNDYLVHPIQFDRDLDLLDQDAVDNAVQNDPACVACHVSLDPLAAYLFGFWTVNTESWLDASIYHPEREQLWVDTLETPPAWYGEAGSGLGGLGAQIASDPRFVSCAVQQAFEGLLRRSSTVDDQGALTVHREAFLAGELRISALLKSVVHDPRYRAGDSADARVDAHGGVPTKLVTADLLASQIEGLTGFRWRYADYDMLQSDIVGLRTLAGGADGRTVVQSAHSPNATIVLVQKRLAELAAVYAVEHALAGEDSALFIVDLTAVPSDEDSAAQIQHLHRAVFGRNVDTDGDEVLANSELWDALYALDGSPEAAWAGVLVALLRDPDLLLY